MVARTKRAPDVQEILNLHIAMSKERDELLEKTRELQAAGKIREARKTFEAAKEVHKRLVAFEHRYRRRNPHDTAAD